MTSSDMIRVIGPGSLRGTIDPTLWPLDGSRASVETGRVRIRKVIHEWDEVVDPPLWREDVVVERVPVNHVIEAPVPIRTEGDTLIVPLLEEVLVVEKRLLLKEELHLTKRRLETHMPQRVTLRREEPVVERINREGPQGNPRAEESHNAQDSHRSA
jgi:uncharacterized protein (TIGR02271 family)